MRPPIRSAVIPSIVALLAAAWWFGSSWLLKPRSSPHGFATTEAAPGLPLEGAPDPRFRFLSPWQLAATPTSIRFDSPMGSADSALAYNAQKFWEMNEARQGRHTGDDLNGIGGMNTDLGDPVFSTADGLVVYAGVPSPGWGNVVIISHRTVDGTVMQSMYAHLLDYKVAPGGLVARGQRVGSVGTANGHYPAHLHFEMRASDGIDLGPGYAMNPLNWLDPMKTVMSLRNAPPELLTASPLQLVMGEK